MMILLDTDQCFVDTCTKPARFCFQLCISIQIVFFLAPTSAPSSSISPLSQSDKVIRRPTKTTTQDDKYKPTFIPSSQYMPPGYTMGGFSKEKVPIEINDHHFPSLPTKTMANHSSASSSISSQHEFKEVGKPQGSTKNVLLSRAQNAYQQQYDDAEGAQRWEEYKQKISEHYLGNLANTPNTNEPVKGVRRDQVFMDDPAVLQVEMASKPRMGRSFPVRLLSNPDDGEEMVSPTPSAPPGLGKATVTDDQLKHQISKDFDETVLKCISEVHNDLVDRDLVQKASGVKLEDQVAMLKNEPMSLPIIGLSAEAAEFVPRPKAVTPAPTTDPEPSSMLGPTSKSTNLSSVEFKHGVKSNITKRQSPTVLVGSSLGMRSPLTVSPSISPGISPPTSQVNNNSPAANLTGSPMFITPKWPPPPLYNAMTRPPPLQPPVLAPATTRFVSATTHPSHLPPPSFGFPGSRMVYSVTPPAVFHMTGMPPQYVPHTSTTTSIEDQAAIATGQPIMATSEASRLISSNGM